MSKNIKTAEELLNDVLTIRAGKDRTLSQVDVEHTDDIALSEPYTALVDAIMGNSSDLEVTLPFETYSKFDPSHIPHDFIINYIYKDTGTTNRGDGGSFIDQAISEYAPLLELADILEGVDIASSDTASSIIAQAVYSLAENTGETPTLENTLGKFIDEKLAPAVIPLEKVDEKKQFSKQLKGIQGFRRVYKQICSLEKSKAITLKGSSAKPELPLWGNDPQNNADAVKYARTMWKLYTAANPGTNERLRLNEGSTYRPDSEGHKIHSNGRFNAVDVHVMRKTDGSKPTDEAVKFFWFLMHHWPGGMGLDISIGWATDTDGNAHIHLDLRGHKKPRDRAPVMFLECSKKCLDNTVQSGIGKGSVPPAKKSKFINDLQQLAAEETAKPGATAVTVNPSVIDEVNTSLDIFTIESTTPKAQEVTSRFAEMLSVLVDLINRVRPHIYKRIVMSSYRHLSIDMTDVTEKMVISSQSGTSTNIPIAGADAPIVQSTGGRVVNVQVNFKIDDYLTLAKLLLMFENDMVSDTRISMLLLDRLLYKKGISPRNRFKYMRAYYREETIKEALSEFSGQRLRSRFDEPVRIQNDLLNSIGLNTFIPSTMEIESFQPGTGVFLVTLGLQYVNLGYRSMESLRIRKRGTTSRVLPIATRLYYKEADDDMNQTARKRENAQAADPERLPAMLSNFAVKYAMLEFLPLYVLYRLNEFTVACERLHNRSLKDYSGESIPEIDLIDPFVRAELISDTDLWDADGKKSWEKIAGLRISSLAALQKQAESASLADRSACNAIAELLIAQKSAMAPYLLSQLSSDNGEIKAFVRRYGMNGNIPSLSIPAYYDLLRDVIDAYRGGNESLMSFVEKVARKASSFIMKASAGYEDQEAYKPPRPQKVTNQPWAKPSYITINRQQKHEQFDYEEVEAEDARDVVGTVKFPSAVRFKVSGKDKTVDISQIVMTYYMGGVHSSLDYPSCVSVFTEDKVDFGLAKIKKDILEDKYIKNQTDDSIKADPMKLSTAITNHMMVTILMGMESAEKIVQKERKETVAKLENYTPYAASIIASATIRDHIGECLVSLITSSLIDVYAAGILHTDPEKFNNPYEKYHERYSSSENCNNKLIEYHCDVMFHNSFGSISMAASSMRQSGYDIRPQVLSGLFVDDAIPEGDPKTGYFNALISTVDTMYVVATLDKDSTNGIGEGNIHSIFKAIHPTVFNIYKDGFVYGLTVISYMWDWFLTILLLALFAKVAIILLLVKIIHVMITTFDIVQVVLLVSEFVGKNNLDVLFDVGSMLALSRWMKQQLYDGIGSGQFLRMCYRSEIWLPSALQYGADMFDRHNTTYMDYPQVKGPGGVPLSPDFYVYKLGMLKAAYNHMVDEINSLTSASAEMAAETENESTEDLARRFLQQTGNAANLIKLETAKMLEDVACVKANGMYPICLAGGVLNTLVLGKYAKERGLVYFQVAGTNIPEPSKYIDQPPKDTCAIHVTVNLDALTVTLDVAHNFLSFVTQTLGDSNKSIESFLVDSNRISQNISGAYAKFPQLNTAIDRTMLIKTIDALRVFVTQFKGISVQAQMTIGEDSGHTLSRLMLARSLVGSYFKKVGTPGAAMMQGKLRSIGSHELARAAHFRSGHMYPTIKLYFIEEDSETYYLFDDLYSYASITSAVVHMDNESPQQTCTLGVTNLYGTLNNVFADQYNLESHFLQGGTEGSSINSMMLRVGCKIKLQMGYTPVLTEEDTVFVGEITNIQFGEITQLEARSKGAILLSDTSTQKMKIYGNEAAAEGSFLGSIVTLLKKALGSVFTRDNQYLVPIIKIRDIVGYVLSDLRITATALTDFTINPDVSAQIDGDLKQSSASFIDAVKDRYVPELSRSFSEQVGAPIDIYQNNQLFENVHIIGDKTLDRFGGFLGSDEGAWLSYKESVWDVLNEINLILPNHLLTTRSFDNRSTLVWTDEDGYYRFRRQVDADNFISNEIIETLVSHIHSGRKMVDIIADVLDSMNESGLDQLKEAGTALFAYICFYAQMIIKSYGMELNKPEYTIDLWTGKKYAAQYAQLWYFADRGKIRSKGIDPFRLGEFESNEAPVGKNVNMIAESLRSNVAKRLDEYGDEVKDSLKDLDNFTGIAAAKVDLRKVASSSNARHIKGEYTVVKDMAIEYACRMVVNYAIETACGKSKSHRRTSETHIKSTGKDIVHNGIELNKPFNAVRVEHPGAGADIEKNAMVSPSVESTGEIPVHYKLAPWAWNIYSTYFKNANAFPNARYSVISMVTSSLLAKLMKGMYQGQITMIGDPRIREYDKILLWDEIQDLYGFVRVKAHTLMYTPGEGCLSVVEPEMITRNDFIAESSFADSVFHQLRYWLGAAAIATVGVLGYRGAGRAFRWHKLQQIKRAAGTLDEVTSATSRILDKIIDSRLYSWVFRIEKRGRAGVIAKLVKTPHEEKLVKNMVKDMAKYRTNLEEMLGSPEAVSAVRTALARGGNRLDSVPEDIIDKLVTDDTIERAIKHLLKNDFGSDNAMSQLKNIHNAAKIGKPGDAAVEEFAEGLADSLSSHIVDAMRSKMAWRNIQKLARKEVDADEVVQGKIYRTLYDMFSPNNTPKKEISQFARIYQRARSRVMNSKSYKAASKSTKKEWLHLVDEVSAGTLYTPHMLRRSLWKIAQIGIGFGTVGWGLDWVQNTVDMVLINGATADNVTVCPLFFRGEPFVAGMDGITKKDGEDAGMTDIFKARFEMLGKSLTHGVSDPIREALFEYAHEKHKVERKY